MKLCITEKPSVAKDIAAILGAKTRRDGYYENDEYCITWTYGHLCTLKEPSDYTEAWKRWALSTLPMIPEKFGIKLINQESIKRQFRVIKQLASQAEEIINCGDAGQEGELIQRWVMQKAGVKCPVKRLWISSLTDESIREGFNSLRPESEFQNLYFAGLSRAIGDWILGLNATRLYSLKYSSPGNTLSIGRVQTPTLALIVARQREIDGFVPEDFWEIKTTYRDTVFNATAGRFADQAKATEIVDRIKNVPLMINSVTEKKGTESPPRLFDLTSLQVECNKRWSWSADKTLNLIQSLYEKKVTTYPRVDTTYLSEDLYPKIPDIMRRMEPYAPLTAPILAGKIIKSKRVFDNAKVTDHHAIIPTGQSPKVLEGDERKLYHLIALRFIAAFYPDCQFLTTTVEASADDVKFKTTGKVIESLGWRQLYTSDKQDGDESDDNKILPPFVVGESGPHKPALQKKTTQPPKFYTEGTLLRAMEGAGKMVEEEELREAMKENGIGRPSTRSAIIETLFKRGYIVRNRKNIHATEAGMALIDTINEDLLKSAKLTGLWENKLRRIERGEYSPAEFIAELKELILKIVYNVLSDNSMRKIEIVKADEARKRSKSKGSSPAKPRKKPLKSLAEIVCPVCGKGHILKGRTAYGCSCYKEGCTFRLGFDKCPADLTPAKVRDTIAKTFKKS